MMITGPGGMSDDLLIVTLPGNWHSIMLDSASGR